MNKRIATMALISLLAGCGGMTVVQQDAVPVPPGSADAPATPPTPSLPAEPPPAPAQPPPPFACIEVAGRVFRDGGPAAGVQVVLYFGYFLSDLESVPPLDELYGEITASGTTDGLGGFQLEAGASWNDWVYGYAIAVSNGRRVAVQLPGSAYCGESVAAAPLEL